MIHILMNDTIIQLPKPNTMEPSTIPTLTHLSPQLFHKSCNSTFKWLKEISPGCSLVGLMLKLKLQYFSHLMWRADSFEKTTWCKELTHLKRHWSWERLKAGGEGDDRGSDGWMASPTQWTWVSVNSGSWWWTGRPRVLQSMGSQRVGHDWATELKIEMIVWTYCTINIYSSSSVVKYLPVPIDMEFS